MLAARDQASEEHGDAHTESHSVRGEPDQQTQEDAGSADQPGELEPMAVQARRSAARIAHAPTRMPRLAMSACIWAAVSHPEHRHPLKQLQCGEHVPSWMKQSVQTL